MSQLVRPRPIGGSALVVDYLNDVSSARRFLPGSPYDLRSFRAKLEEVTSRFGRDERAAAAAALRPTSDRARERLRRFVADGGVMVTTGQQSGFLTGPLYTVYKAISAVVLASHLEERLGVLVLPVFWIASEDHDWAEANHAYVLDPAGRVRRFDLPAGDPRPLPMSERRLEGDLEELCDEVLQIVGNRSDTYGLSRKIVDPYRRSGTTVAAAFNEAMTALLERFDVLFADAAEPALKAASARVLASAIADASRQEEALAARTRAIESAGYATQVPILAEATNVFSHAERGRERIVRRGESYLVRGRKGLATREQLVAEIEGDPTRFSPNVLLRPVVESAVLPTVAYVGGPGEIAYFAQAGALFEDYGIRPPVAVPRFSGVVVDDAVERTAASLGLSEADLAQPREVLIDRLARREIPGATTDAIDGLRREIVAAFERVIEEAAFVDSSLKGSLGALRNRVLHQAGDVERKVVRAAKRRNTILVEQLDRVLDTLRPNGGAQDRTLNVLPFLVRYGEHFLAETEAAIRAHWRLPEE